MMMNREHREWTARLSDYLADELQSDERTALEAHLGACDACRGVLADLQSVMAQARALGDLEPPRDLWADISAAIGEGNGGSADVIALPRGHASRGGTSRRVEVSRPRLAAAAVVLVALSATLGWWVGPARQPVAGSPGETERGVFLAAGDTPEPPPALAEELAALEDIVASAREVLDPSTVLVIERSLGVIEQAIADSREALLQDPSNAFLAEHLERMYRRKLVYLQDAVRLVEWGG